MLFVVARIHSKSSSSRQSGGRGADPEAVARGACCVCVLAFLAFAPFSLMLRRALGTDFTMSADGGQCFVRSAQVSTTSHYRAKGGATRRYHAEFNVVLQGSNETQVARRYRNPGNSVFESKSEAEHYIEHIHVLDNGTNLCKRVADQICQFSTSCRDGYYFGSRKHQFTCFQNVGIPCYQFEDSVIKMEEGLPYTTNNVFAIGTFSIVYIGLASCVCFCGCHCGSFFFSKLRSRGADDVVHLEGPNSSDSDLGGIEVTDTQFA
mmetsp:Transcript_46150/g.86463  ORF Transcript_46150/g.86463 Transcript_46150/m.86463 type:complete len:264 (+) Transcript_46150:79-870(+)